MSYLKLFLLSLISITVLADPGGNGGSRVGNGGSGCICRENGSIARATLLDLNLAEELKYIINRESKEDFDTILYRKIIRLSKNKSILKEVEEKLASIKSIITFEDGNFELGPVNDYTKMVCRSKYGPTCNVEQIANYTFEGKLLIVSEKFKALSNVDKAALFMHEILYSLDRQYTNAYKSDWAQEITAKLFAENTKDNDILHEIEKHFLLTYEDAAKITDTSLIKYFQNIQKGSDSLSVNKVKYLIFSGANVNEIAEDKNVLMNFLEISPKETQMSIHAAVFNLLIERGANINYVNPLSKSTLISILTNYYKLVAQESVPLRQYYENLITELLQKENFSPVCIRGKYFINDKALSSIDPISWALKHFKDKSIVTGLIINNIKYDKSFQCDGGFSVMHFVANESAIYRKSEFVEPFLKAGFSCNVRNILGKTPIEIFNSAIGYCSTFFDNCQYRRNPEDDAVKVIFRKYNCGGRYSPMQAQ